MRYGHGPSGIIGATLSETTLATWALSQTQWDKCRIVSLNWSTTKSMLCCVIWKNSQFTLTTIHVTGRAFVKQLRHELTCLMRVNIKLNDEALLPVQAMAINVAANKEQLIRLLVKHLWKLIVPNGKRLVVTGPDPRARLMLGVEVLPRAITNEEADIIMAYNMIEESVGGRSPI